MEWKFDERLKYYLNFETIKKWYLIIIIPFFNDLSDQNLAECQLAHDFYLSQNQNFLDDLSDLDSDIWSLFFLSYILTLALSKFDPK